MDLQLTTKAQEAFAQAATTAAAKHHPAIEPAHLLLGLAAQQGTTTPALLEKAGSSVGAATATVKPPCRRCPAAPSSPSCPGPRQRRSSRPSST